MTETAHLNPLPSRKERGGPAQEYLRRPQAFAAARYPFYASKVVLLLWILAVAVRLVLIDQPYVDDWSWRQSDVAAIARNFFEGGFRFGYPQIDWAANSAGYVGTEFPILPFLAAICYKFAGIHEWMGRSQSVIFFAISLPFFFLLVREIFDGTTAIWATFFYAFAPLNIFAGRSFMPDVPSLGLGIIGLYFFLRSARDPKPASFYLSAIAISLSILIKATSVVIAAPLLYLAVAEGADHGPDQPRHVRGSRSQRQRLHLLAFAAIALLPSVAWYWHAHQIAERYYPHHFFGAGGVRLESFSWYWDIAQQTATLASHHFWRLWRCSVCSSRRAENMAAFLIGGWLPWFCLLRPLATAIAIHGTSCLSCQLLLHLPALHALFLDRKFLRALRP